LSFVSLSWSTNTDKLEINWQIFAQVCFYNMIVSAQLISQMHENTCVKNCLVINVRLWFRIKQKSGGELIIAAIRFNVFIKFYYFIDFANR